MLHKTFFTEPLHPMQKKYEALRASYVDKLTDQEVAEKFDYSYYGYKTIKRDCKQKNAGYFFTEIKKGKPSGMTEKSLSFKERIIELRKKNYSVDEIKEKLEKESIKIGQGTISNILHNEGFAKLFRRTNVERLEALQSDRVYPEGSDINEFGKYNNFTTSYGGIFLFLPLIVDLGLGELFNIDGLYGSKIIPRQNYMFSYLSLKLLGKDRLCHINDFSFDYGLGLFAGLNVLPKSTAISSYSYRHSPDLVRTILKGFSKKLFAKGYIQGKNINLDFHSIPYYGDEPTLENNWIPMRGKRMKSILSFFAQDLDTTFLFFSDGNIKNNEASDEILSFVEFYKDSIGLLPECLMFDSKLTTYKNLYQLNEQGIKFITLGRRGKNFPAHLASVPSWTGVRLDGVNREYRNLKYFQQMTKIRNYPKNLKEVIVSGTGRELPMRLLTNDNESKIRDVLQKYARRWRIENNIQENVDFFSLNALSSPVIVQVDFDIAMTLVANTLYKILAKKTKWLEKAKPKTVARQIMDTKANVSIKDDEIIIKYANRTYNPVIREWTDNIKDIRIPWLNNRKINYEFS